MYIRAVYNVYKAIYEVRIKSCICEWGVTLYTIQSVHTSCIQDYVQSVYSLVFIMRVHVHYTKCIESCIVKVILYTIQKTVYTFV